MWLPKKVKIGAHWWKVVKIKNTLEEEMDFSGSCSPATQTIKIVEFVDHRPYAPGALFQTFLHEAIGHAVDGVYCDHQVFKGAKHGDESEWIDPFCEGMMQFLVDNWSALEKMKKELDKG